MVRPAFTKPSATTAATQPAAAKPAESAHAEPRSKSASHTHVEGSARARMPHERDESLDTQQASPDRIGEQAYEDAASDRADTSLAPVTDSVYRKLKK